MNADSTGGAGRVVRWICIAVIALTSLEFVVATTGVLLRQPAPAHTDFASYYMAGVLAREHRSPYDAAALVARSEALGLGQSTYPFVYPPPFAIAMRALAALPFETARRIWVLLTTVALFGMLGATWRLGRALSARLEITSPLAGWLVMAAFAPAALNSASVHSDIRVGSVGVLFGACTAIIAWRSLAGARPSPWVGLVLALAALAKTTPVVLIAWVAWRGARRTAAWSVAWLGLAFVPAVWVWGPGIIGDWLQHGVLARLAVPSGWAHNQSLNAALLRLCVPAALDGVTVRAPLLQQVLVWALTAGVAVSTWSCVRIRSRPAAMLPLECSLIVLAILIVTPITWVHTMAALLFVWPVQMLVLARAAAQRWKWTPHATWAACAGFFLSSAHLPVLWGTALHHRPWVALTTLPLAGMLISFATCVVLLHHAPVVAAATPGAIRQSA